MARKTPINQFVDTVGGLGGAGLVIDGVLELLGQNPVVYSALASAHPALAGGVMVVTGLVAARKIFRGLR